MTISARQIRAARALLGLGQEDLARRASVSVVTVRRVEAAERTQPVSAATVNNIVQALERSGAVFIEGGVQWREPHSDAPPDQDPLGRLASATQRRSLAGLGEQIMPIGGWPLRPAAQARARAISLQTGMSEAEIVEDALRCYVPQAGPQPVGRLARIGALLVLPGNGRPISLDAANRALDDTRNRDR